MRNSLAKRGGNALAVSNPHQGLSGWFRRLCQVVVVAACTALGGPLGGLTGAIASWAFNELWSDGGMRRPTTAAENDLYLQRWAKEELKPWLDRLMGPNLSGSDNTKYLKSAEYREKVNKVLKTLEAFRVYHDYNVVDPGYTILGEKIKTYRTDDWVSRAKVISTLKFTVWEGYVKAIKDAGGQAYAKKISFDCKNHNGSYPQRMDWSNRKSTISELIVFTTKEDGTPAANTVVFDENGKVIGTVGDVAVPEIVSSPIKTQTTTKTTVPETTKTATPPIKPAPPVHQTTVPVVTTPTKPTPPVHQPTVPVVTTPTKPAPPVHQTTVPETTPTKTPTTTPTKHEPLPADTTPVVVTETVETEKTTASLANPLMYVVGGSMLLWWLFGKEEEKEK